MVPRPFFLLLFVAAAFLTACTKNEPVPVAGFSYTGTNGVKVPCTVTFNNTSSNASAYLWKFGDDSTSVVPNPVHTFTKPGKYAVYLRAYTESQREWASVVKALIIADTIK